MDIIKNVWLGPPSRPSDIYFIPEEGICKGPQYYYQFGVPYASYVDSWYWDLQPPVIILGSNTGMSIKLYYPSYTTDGTYSVAVKAINTCGESPYLIKYFEVKDCDRCGLLTFNLYPNPADDVLTIEIEPDESIVINPDAETELRLYDAFMLLKKQKTFKGTTTTLNVSDLPNGIYILQIKINEELYKVNDFPEDLIKEISGEKIYWEKILIRH